MWGDSGTTVGSTYLNVYNLSTPAINNYDFYSEKRYVKPNKKYRDFTTMQLETLRYRILFNLEESIKGHIISWEKRMNEIELVAEVKGYKL